MVSISCILPTARSDYSIIGQPDVHIFEPTLRSLSRQVFRDFELIVVDALYPKRGSWFEDSRLPFPVKYVPVHPNHRFWLNRKRWGVCGQLNTGILHADGELLVRIDDCSEFPDTRYLERFWEGYQSGFFPMAMHIRYLEGKPARVNSEYLEKGYEMKHSESWEQDKEEMLKRLYGDEGLIRDTRYPVVKAHGGRMIAPINWYYGYSSVSLEAALRVNGYDELFDGDKSLEDCDMGSRLTMSGYRNMFLLDTDLQVIEHEHAHLPESIITPSVKPIKCNYAILLHNQHVQRWRSNVDELTSKNLEFIREESLKPPCSPKPNFYEDDCRGELFDLWASNQPLFDLREERLFV